MNLDPHMKQLADVLVAICVRELKTQKPEDKSGFCRNVPLTNEDWNDGKNITDRLAATARHKFL